MERSAKMLASESGGCKVGGGGSEGRPGSARALWCRLWCGKAATKLVEVSEGVGLDLAVGDLDQRGHCGVVFGVGRRQHLRRDPPMSDKSLKVKEKLAIEKIYIHVFSFLFF